MDIKIVKYLESSIKVKKSIKLDINITRLQELNIKVKMPKILFNQISSNTLINDDVEIYSHQFNMCGDFYCGSNKYI